MMNSEMEWVRSQRNLIAHKRLKIEVLAIDLSAAQKELKCLEDKLETTLKSTYVP